MLALALSLVALIRTFPPDAAFVRVSSAIALATPTVLTISFPSLSARVARLSVLFVSVWVAVERIIVPSASGMRIGLEN